MAGKELPATGRTAQLEGKRTTGRPRRDYSPPRVLSAEPLEAAAATCNPPAGGFGKTVPFPCSTGGS